MRTSLMVRSAAVGVVSGLVAAAMMNAFQAGWSAVQSQGQADDEEEASDEPSTVKAADKVSQAVRGQPVPNGSRNAAGEAVHYAFGGFLGGLYGAASSAVPELTRGFGMPFGAAVWLTADEAAVPALGLSGPPQETPLAVHAYSLISHLVFGTVLEGSRRVLEPAAEQLFGPQRQQG